MNNEKLNKLRAAILGANDGIISVATALVVVAGTFTRTNMILTAIAVILAGAFSMSAGEYTSVAAQRDVERHNQSEQETSPTHAAIASFLSFFAGAALPATIAIIAQNIAAITISALIALAITSLIAAPKGFRMKGTIRMVSVGGLSLSAGIAANLLLGSAI